MLASGHRFHYLLVIWAVVIGTVVPFFCKHGIYMKPEGRNGGSGYVVKFLAEFRKMYVCIGKHVVVNHISPKVDWWQVKISGCGLITGQVSPEKPNLRFLKRPNLGGKSFCVDVETFVGLANELFFGWDRLAASNIVIDRHGAGVPNILPICEHPHRGRDLTSLEFINVSSLRTSKGQECALNRFQRFLSDVGRSLRLARGDLHLAKFTAGDSCIDSGGNECAQGAEHEDKLYGQSLIILGSLLAFFIFCGSQVRYTGRNFYLYLVLALLFLPLSFLSVMYGVELLLK